MSKTINIVVPDIGDYSDIPVIELLVEPGQQVEAEQSLVTLESDKATMEIPSTASGIVRELKLALNDTVSAGDVVAVLQVADTASGDQEAASADPDPEQAPSIQQSDGNGQAANDSDADRGKESGAEKAEEGSVEQSVEPASAAGPAVSGRYPADDPTGVPYASPAIRLFARELGVDLMQVNGSGRKGRIRREDVAGFVKTALSVPTAADGGGSLGPGFDLPPLPDIDFSRFGDTESRDLTRIQKIAGANLHRNWVSIPHVTQHDHADITDMEAFRKANAQDAIDQGFKLTPLVFLIKATVAALKKFDQFNASLDKSGERLILKKYFNVGIAVDTRDGLVVPVIRECDRKGIMELARELAEVSARAREKKLRPQDLQGGCISISSLGGIGGTGFSPIINAPEVAILGVARSQIQPNWDGTQFQPRLMLPLSLSYDHRVIDGAAAARFTRYLASRLEDLRRLTL